MDSIKILVIDEYENLYIISCTLLSMFLLIKMLTTMHNPNKKKLSVTMNIVFFDLHISSIP